MTTKDNAVDATIIGAGPAGLAAATKLADKKKILVLEKESSVGGISKTIEYKGFRFDLGGHRFFTKSTEVNDLWSNTLQKDFITRPRLSRIYYKEKFFDYPIKPMNALKNLGLAESCIIMFSYLKSKAFPYREEKSFDQWVSNRFGKRLFNHFFKSYTEKLWGIPCTEIQAEWAAQRIKGLSLTATIKNALFPDKSGKIKTLIDEFQYPKLGPGMMYEKMADNVMKSGAEISMCSDVVRIDHDDFQINSVTHKKGDAASAERTIPTKYLLSSMPLTTLVESLYPSAPVEVLKAASNLTYRSFITVSLILKSQPPFPDTWIYVHSPSVRLGRIQNFKSWSPYMVPKEGYTALGMEYFCTEGDDLWEMEDNALISLAVSELEKIGLGKASTFEDGFVSRVPKAYPTYDSSYPNNIKIIRNYIDRFKNLQPIGRYGMFKYNNMDHSILTGLYAAENILGAKHDIWSVNADQEYHEEK